MNNRAHDGEMISGSTLENKNRTFARGIGLGASMRLRGVTVEIRMDVARSEAFVAITPGADPFTLPGTGE